MVVKILTQFNLIYLNFRDLNGRYPRFLCFLKVPPFTAMQQNVVKLCDLRRFTNAAESSAAKKMNRTLANSNLLT